jgi:endonuclease III
MGAFACRAMHGEEAVERGWRGWAWRAAGLDVQDDDKQDQKPPDDHGWPGPEPIDLATMKPKDVILFFDRLAEERPAPRGELAYVDPYTLLVAVVLSAQATDVSVNKATERLFKVAATPEAMVRLGVEGLIPYVRTIGLYQGKSKNIIRLSEILLAEHGGKVPADRAILETLPGVGRKTANVVMNVAFGEPTIAVDTHIFRVANRTGLAPGKTPRAVEDRLEKVVPADRKLYAHHWLILHGRYVCKARRPDCPACVVRDLCGYKAKTVVEAAAPALSGRPSGGGKAAPRSKRARPRSRPAARAPRRG